MQTLSTDARRFVAGVVSHLKQEGKQDVASRLNTLLTRVTHQAKQEKQALVVTSVALTSEEKMRVEKILARLLGHAVDVQYSVNAAIIAGLTIRVADWVVDTSLAGQLRRLEESLIS